MHTRGGVITAVALVLSVGGGVWYLGHASVLRGEPEGAASATEVTDAAPGFVTATSSAPAAAGPLAPPREVPAGMREYRNTTYRFSLFYPSDLSVKEYDEGGGAQTITFQNPATIKGFQIFIVPYSDSQISQARFRADAPSGTMQSPQPLSIDGALATMFIGSNIHIGPTREVWFIHGGYLFESTAPQSLDNWLGAIMTTWAWL